MRAELQWASRRRLLLLVSLGWGSSVYVVQLFEVCILLLEWVAPTVRVGLRVTMLVLREASHEHAISRLPGESKMLAK